MFKTLAAKAFIPVAVTVTGFVTVCCLLLYSVIKEDMTRDSVQHATNLADTVLKSTRYAMLKSDRETLSNIIRNIGEQKGVEHVRIFNKKGLIMISSHGGEINSFVDKKSEGCITCHAGPVPITTLGPMEQARKYLNRQGKEELAITAPVYNEPECFSAPCHFHPATQKVLGTLDIGLSQGHLHKALAKMKVQMTVFTLLTLILTVGGVSALLLRSVFLPIRKLEDFTSRLANGATKTEIPHFPEDLDRVARTVYKMAHGTTATSAREREEQGGVSEE
jgi:HAMP domain-containing protein